MYSNKIQTNETKNEMENNPTLLGLYSVFHFLLLENVITACLLCSAETRKTP